MLNIKAHSLKTALVALNHNFTKLLIPIKQIPHQHDSRSRAGGVLFRLGDFMGDLVKNQACKCLAFTTAQQATERQFAWAGEQQAQ